MAYKTKGTCAVSISFDIEEGLLRNVHFTDGCPGSLAAVSALVEGMPAKEAAGKLKGIKCGRRGTSCPDQLALAIEKHYALSPPE